MFRRQNYMQFYPILLVSLLYLSIVVKIDSDPKKMAALLTVSSFAYGVVDTVVDGLWVT